MKKCKECGKDFNPFSSIQAWCSPECGYKLSQRKKKEKEQSKLREEYLKSINGYRKKPRKNDISTAHETTWKIVSELVLYRDRNQGCISCGSNKHDVQYAAGHYKTRGGHPELTYNLKNLNKQCNHYCNKNLSGNIEGTKTTHGQKAGIVERYGQDRLDYLDGAHKRIKYTIEDLAAFRAECREILNEMKSGKPYREPILFQNN